MRTVGGIECHKTKIPGVYRLPDGGHLVRALVTNPNNKKREEVFQVMRNQPSAIRAGAWLESEKAKIKSGEGRRSDEARSIPKLKDFAESLLQEKSGER